MARRSDTPAGSRSERGHRARKDPLWIARVPLAFALGLLAGVLTFIPYLGVLLSIAPALLLAGTKGPWALLWVVVVFAVAHGLLDGRARARAYVRARASTSVRAT